MTHPGFTSLLLAAAVSSVLALPAFAGGQQDADRARDLYSHGDIQDLSGVLKRATAATPGDVVSVDLVQENGGWFYRIEIVQPNGHQRIVELRASKDDDGGDTNP
jgi:uncharacterized membrane protein YkoI